MKRRSSLGSMAVFLLILGTALGSEPAGREHTFRAHCRDASHGRQGWSTAAYTSVAPALMFARKHNEANPGHEASVAILHGAEPAHVADRR
jgi:hypothetical protein